MPVEKSYTNDKANHYITFLKATGYKGGNLVGFFNLPEKLANGKMLYQWMGLLFNIAIQYGNVLQVSRNGSKTFSITIIRRAWVHIHTYAYCYPLFENGMKTGL